MKMDAKSVLIPALTLFLICAVVTGLLAGTNLLTKDVIAQQEAAAEEASRKIVLSSAESFEKKTLSVDGTEVEYYEGTDASGAVAGLVFTTAAKGYGGDINVITGIGSDGSVAGVVILSLEETPGLGANAQNESFLNQYQGGAGPFEVIKSGTPSENQIQALTGATISSKAVTEAVNQAVSYYELAKEGE